MHVVLRSVHAHRTGARRRPLARLPGGRGGRGRQRPRHPPRRPRPRARPARRATGPPAGQCAGAAYSGVARAPSGRAACAGLRYGMAGRDVGPVLERGPAQPDGASAAGGLIGDRLERERPQLAIPWRCVPTRRRTPRARRPSRPPSRTPPGGSWCSCTAVRERRPLAPRPRAPRHDVRRGAGRRRLDPVLLRANTGLSVRANGAALAALLDDLVEAWPVPVERIALVGPLDGRAGDPRRRRGDRAGDRVARAGHRRRHARYAPPRGPAGRRGRHRERAASGGCPRRRRSGGSSTSGPRRRRPGRRPRGGLSRRCRTSATGSSRRPSTPPRATRSAASSVTCWCASRRRTAATEGPRPLPRCRGAARATAATSTCSTTPRSVWRCGRGWPDGS